MYCNVIEFCPIKHVKHSRLKAGAFYKFKPTIQRWAKLTAILCPNIYVFFYNRLKVELILVSSHHKRVSRYKFASKPRFIVQFSNKIHVNYQNTFSVVRFEISM